MSNYRSATPLHDQQMAWYAHQHQPIAWTPEQQVRLEHEWRQLQRSFAYHAAVRIVPLIGNPPSEYQVEFRCRTLHIRDDGVLDYFNTPSVHIWLPAGYPHDPPVVRPMQQLFHPNITMDAILIAPAWEPTHTLAQLVERIGAMLAFHTYDPWNPWNPAALEWVHANVPYLPTDPAANFSPQAGGEPLGRICQQGAKTVDQLRTQMQELCASLLSPDEPPGSDEVRTFAEKIRLATNLFLDDEVPNELRMPATEVDQWAEALPSATMTFESLRQRHLAANAALAAASKVAESRRVLIKEIASFEEMVANPPAEDPMIAIEQVPALAHMQAAQANFRMVTTEAEKRLAMAKARLEALAPPDPRSSFSHSELLEKTIESEIGRAAWAVQDAQDKASAAVETITPTIERARAELGVFERIISWREYADVSAKAEELVERIVNWGSGGVQAYFVENEGGIFGPFELEQRLDLGDLALTVRNLGESTLEVYDLKSGSRIGRGANAATIALPSGETGVSFKTIFRFTSRCDDLRVQLEYLSRQIADIISHLAQPLDASKSSSWATRFNQTLSGPGFDVFAEQARGGAQGRAALVSDLKALGRFKERLATQFLVERWCEMLPRFQQERAQAQKNLKDATQRIAEIFARSQRDIETGMPMIPPKFAKEYETNKTKRDDSQDTIERVERRFEQAVQQIKPRLSNTLLYGSDEIPQPILLAHLPDDLLARREVISEFEMASSIAYLEQELKTPLRPPAPAVAAPVQDLAPEQSLEVDQTLLQGEAPVEPDVVVEDAVESDQPHDFVDFNPEGSKPS